MKIRRAMLVAILLVTMPVLSACDLFGNGDSNKDEATEYYEQQLEAYIEAQEEAYRAAQEAYRQAQEEYYELIRQGLEEWLEAYQEWWDWQIQQQLGQIEGLSTDNQS